MKWHGLSACAYTHFIGGIPLQRWQQIYKNEKLLYQTKSKCINREFSSKCCSRCWCELQMVGAWRTNLPGRWVIVIVPSSSAYRSRLLGLLHLWFKPLIIQKWNRHSSFFYYVEVLIWITSLFSFRIQDFWPGVVTQMLENPPAII